MVVNVYAGGDTDGVLSAAVIWRKFTIANMFYPLTGDMPGMLADRTVKKGDELYFVGFSLRPREIDLLYDIVKEKPEHSRHLYDNHRSPKNLLDTPFAELHIDIAQSCCEQVYTDLDSTLDPMIPAMASINEGLQHTDLIAAARKKHGERLDINAELIRYAFMADMTDDVLKKAVSKAIAGKALPDELPWLVEASAHGEKLFNTFWSQMESPHAVLNNLAYAFVPQFPAGFARSTVTKIAAEAGKHVGAGILNRGWSKTRIVIISTDPDTDIGTIVRQVSSNSVNSGGNLTRANVSVTSTRVHSYLRSLDEVLSEYAAQG